MKIALRNFRVKEGIKVRLDDWPTRAQAFYDSEASAKARLAAQVERMSELQQRLYASGSRALLLLFQGMDASGKDGMIRHVMSGVNPQGCQVVSFKQPSRTELQHDFLWRSMRELPERGRIGIFNRSYYEEVLVVRVHPELLVAEGALPGRPDGKPDAKAHGKFWRERFRSIEAFERHLDENGTTVVKFFLHLSRDEQKKRFLERIDDPKKNWKFDTADVEERRHWDSYMSAYGECIAATSSRRAPWYVVPADDKQNARLIVSQAIVETMEGLDIHYPQADRARKAHLQEIRGALLAD